MEWILLRFDITTGKVTQTATLEDDDVYDGRQDWLGFATADGGFAAYKRQDRDFMENTSLPQLDAVVFYSTDLRENRRLTDLIGQALATDPMVQDPPTVTDFVVNGTGSIFINLRASEDADSRGGIYEFNADGLFQRRIVVEQGFSGDLTISADGALWYSDPWLNFLQRIDGPDIEKHILVQNHRNAKAAKRFLKRLIDRFGEPRVMVTDKLRSYIKPIKSLAPDADHRAHKGLNNRVEGSHRPTRKREKIMGCFKSPRHAQQFLYAHDQASILFKPRRYKMTADHDRQTRSDAFDLWNDYTADMTA